MIWMPGGHNNWFSVSVDGPRFQVRFERKASKLYKNFDEAADQAAQLLYKEWGHRPLYLALSGGVDSEFVARILLKNKIPFTPVILKIDSINDIESQFALTWCEKNNITPVILNYTTQDLNNNFKLFFPKMHKIKHYHSTPMMTIYKYVETQGGHCIYCAGDINLDSDRKEFFHYHYDFIPNMVDAAKHPTSFFMYTPELVLSYINQFDTTQPEQLNKLGFYQVESRSKIEYISLLPQDQNKKTMDNLFHIFKIKKQEFDACYWYGTKEQIIQNLQP